MNLCSLFIPSIKAYLLFQEHIKGVHSVLGNGIRNYYCLSLSTFWQNLGIFPCFFAIQFSFHFAENLSLTAKNTLSLVKFELWPYLINERQDTLALMINFLLLDSIATPTLECNFKASSALHPVFQNFGKIGKGRFFWVWKWCVAKWANKTPKQDIVLSILNTNWNSHAQTGFHTIFIYCPFYKTLPRSRLFINWISVLFYETDCSINLVMFIPSLLTYMIFPGFIDLVEMPQAAVNDVDTITIARLNLLKCILSFVFIKQKPSYPNSLIVFFV